VKRMRIDLDLDDRDHLAASETRVDIARSVQ
jgi:hypothetical protein